MNFINFYLPLLVLISGFFLKRTLNLLTEVIKAAI